jgi:hypothetical protein
MTTKESMLTALRGGKPGRMPLTTYDILWEQAGVPLGCDVMMRLRAKGMGIIAHVDPYRIETPHVERTVRSYKENGQTITEERLSTPVGAVSSRMWNDWVQEYCLKTPADYRVMEYIVRDQVIEPDYEKYRAAERALGEDGIVIMGAQRTPYQKMLVDLAGLESFSYHLADDAGEVESLFGALLQKQKRIVDIVSAGPGDVVKIWENLTGDAVGERRYRQYHLPVYEQLYPVVHGAGKLLALHYDGRLACLKDAIGEAPFDIVESFTPPPEGDMGLEEALALWPGKVLWLTLPFYAYRSDDALRAYLRMIRKVSCGVRLLPEIAEYFPAETWQRHADIMLEELG